MNSRLLEILRHAFERRPVNLRHAALIDSEPVADLKCIVCPSA